MADPQPPIAPGAHSPPPPQAESQPQPASQPEIPFHGTPPVLHYSAIGVSILGPIAFLMPNGRKTLSSQLQNMVLASGSFWGFNQLAYDYSGKSIVQRSNERWSKIFSSVDQGLPTDRARQVKAQLEAQKAQRRQDEAARVEAERLRREDEENKKRGLLTRVWMGDEGDDWKQRRIEEDKKALESGKGYGDIIMDQIWEVWNQGTGKEKKDEKAEDAASQGQKAGGGKTGENQ
ncbi:hypothetical protein NKR19_g8268 [Coniochaeta hoffmannii]|uniref:Rhomboid family membrane protein n=1 Tax=Coniochaeta hoffmannii TaxID=91930 RepID=A0AA38RNK9_9PEZI|nr:hypothetical protein NKR19_g8268 [Coniochaeta hoffmannii]